jgi:hypothetical protein
VKVPDARPQLHHLQRVVAVSQTQSAQGISITRLSLERYQDGFAAHFRFTSDDPRYSKTFRPFIKGTDTLGQTYVHHLLAGNGRGRPLDWRKACSFTPPPVVFDVVIEVTAINSAIQNPAPSTPITTERRSGPWVFHVPLL